MKNLYWVNLTGKSYSKDSFEYDYNEISSEMDEQQFIGARANEVLSKERNQLTAQYVKKVMTESPLEKAGKSIMLVALLGLLMAVSLLVKANFIVGAILLPIMVITYIIGKIIAAKADKASKANDEECEKINGQIQELDSQIMNELDMPADPPQVDIPWTAFQTDAYGNMSFLKDELEVDYISISRNNQYLYLFDGEQRLDIPVEAISRIEKIQENIVYKDIFLLGMLSEKYAQNVVSSEDDIYTVSHYYLMVFEDMGEEYCITILPHNLDIYKELLADRMDLFRE